MSPLKQWVWFYYFLFVSAFLVSFAAVADIEVTNTVNPRSNYRPGQTLDYTMSVANKGGVVTPSLEVNALVSSVLTLWANSNDPAVYDEADVPNQPAFTTWTITVESLGDNSSSALGKGTTLTDKDLADTVVIAPDEQVIYRVRGTTSAVSIGVVTVTFTARAEDGSFSEDAPATVKPFDNMTTPKVTKKAISNDYVPGDWVSYEIIVENPSGNLFADNFTIVDEIESCLKVEMNDGSWASPFEKYIFKVKSVEGDGSDPGNWPPGYGSEQTGDIQNTLDIAPKGKVVYSLDALVKPTAIGTILDNGEGCPDNNVIEDGAGLDTPDGKPEVLKEVDKFYYTAGEDVTFTITIKNTGRGPLTTIPVVDDLPSVKALDVFNLVKSAFTTWTIEAKAVDKDGNLSTNSNPDIDGTIAPNQPINTHVNIYPGDSIIYTIVATLSTDLTTDITNTVEVGDGASSSITTHPKKSDLEVYKTVDKEHYIADDGTITYKIVVSNHADAGFARDVPVDDDIQNIQAELLHPSGAKASVFSSWVITAEEVGKGTVAGINPDYDTAGLHAKANIAAGGKVTYTIVATLNPVSQDHIVWGKFTNTVTVTTPDGSESDSAYTGVKVPDIRPKKSVDVPNLKPGETVTYTIVIENAGNGYANDTLVTDNISGLGIFTTWTITYDAPGVGSRVIDGVKDNENINTKVDIAPHSSITFYVTGIVISDLGDIEKATNTVNTHDPITDREGASSADLDVDPNKKSFGVTKFGSGVYFTPGKTFTYTITVTNEQSVEVKHLTLTDRMKAISAWLANDRGGTHYDVEGHPFEQWRWQINGGAWEPWGTENIVVSDFNMLAKSSLTLVIECQVKDNVVSRKITNVVDVEQEITLPDGAKVAKNVGHASVDNLRADSGGLVVREIEPRYYKPGDEVTITVTASSVTGYFNNVTIKEAVSALQVDTIDKGLVNPFDGKWTVVVQNNDTHKGGTTDGTKDTGIVEDNKDLDAIIDVGGGDSVIYTIKGIVVDDASGEIDYRDDTVFPYDKQYRYTKTTIEKNYLPGSPLTYKISLKNLGLKHLVDLPFVDLLSAVKVEDTNGALVNAFTNWTIQAAGLPIPVDLSTGAKPAYEAFYKIGAYENNKDINTKVSIPIGGEIEVLIHANVVGSAIGSITNEMVFDDNSTSVIINPEVNNAIINKTVVDSFAADGEPMRYLKYSPGGTVTFDLKISNAFGGNIVGLSVIDKLSALTTKWYDGSTGRALESWTIDVTFDDGGVTQALPVTANNDINELVTIGVGGWVNYRIKAVIMQEAVGSIINHATAGKAKGATSPIKMAPAQFHVSKDVYADAALTQPKQFYEPGETVYYLVIMDNSGYGTLYNKHVNDIISAVVSGSGNPAFASWTVTPLFRAGRVTNLEGFTGGANADIDTDFDVAPRDKIRFVIEAVIAGDATNVINNTVTASGESDEASIISGDNLTVKFYVDESVYIPGNPITYHYEFTNNSPLSLLDIHAKTAFWQSFGDWINDQDLPPVGGKRTFDSFTLNCTADNPESSCGAYRPENFDLNASINIAPGSTVKYTIVPTVNINMLSKIVVGASYGASAFPSGAPTPKLSENLVAEPVKPVISQMAVTKEAELHADNKGVTYTLTAVNPGQGNLASIHLFDNLSAITSKEGRPVFRSWTFNAVETKMTGETIPVPLAPNQNLDMDWNFENNSRNTLRISINALFQGNIDEEVMNVFKAIKPQDTGVAVQDNASIHVSHQSIGEGDLVVTKSALTPQIQPGGAVEYEINVNNPHDSYFEDVSIIDHYPAGFRYIEGTGKIKCTNDESFRPLEPTVTNVLTFYPINLDPFHQCSIRYVLKPSIGIRPGSYKNTAFAQSDEGNPLSNQSNALVSVTGDKLFDTGSIIGKVFEDHNGNGYQSDATAKGIRVKVAMPQGDYVPNSLHICYLDKVVRVRNQTSLFNKGLGIPDLWGISLRPHSKPMSAKVSFISSKATPYPLTVSSTTGSSLSLAPSGKIEQISTGNLAKGLCAEQLTLERKIMKVTEGFRHELTLTNAGRYDDGIPGVRLITAEGYKIETDEHGRFHVPDRWVLDSKGKNFVIKVDTDSLPDRMKVISENPKVIRITPNKLNKVNFSVQRQ